MAERARATVAAIVSRASWCAAVIICGAACARPAPGPGAGTTPPVGDGRVARVSLGTSASPALSATGAWRLVDRDGRTVARGDSGERLTLASARGVVRIIGGSAADREVAAPLSMIPAGHGALVTFNGRRYRGELAVVATDSSLRVVNRVGVEDYLRGVVPREIGIRNANERAAVEAQAVAARSYAVTRMGNATRPYDLVATTGDQVYGGVDSENALADASIAATAGLVIYYGERIVSAPYSSTCGGSTAEPLEVWRSRNEPYLQRVSDRIPGTERHYCDVAPRFRWEQSWTADTLTALIERYLRSYVRAPSEPLGAVRAVTVAGRTPSGRVGALVVEMDRGRYRLEANDIRYVLRSAGGELLNSTYFSPDVLTGVDGRLSRLTVRGVGYGHGVGMCQWGAIGRARAGQDFRTILRTYFPGTRVARAY